MPELGARCSQLAAELRAHQVGTVAQINKEVNLGLVCVCCILMQWPDIHLPRRLVSGFATTGIMEESYLFETHVYDPPSVTKDDLLYHSAGLVADMERAPTDEEATFLWDSCRKEHDKGFG